MSNILTFAIVIFVIYRLCSVSYECGRRRARRERDNDLHDKN